jgi:hypothetical protein
MSYRSTKSRFHLFAAGLLLWAAPALGQGQKLPVDLTLPPASVIGRPSTIGPGQATAIPFAQLASQLAQFGLLTNPLTFAQFPAIGASTVIGSVAGGAPIALSSTQITAMINLATALLPGALPAWPGNATTFFRGDGTYATLNLGAIGGFGTGVAAALGNNIGSAGAPVTNGGALGTPSSGTISTGMTLGGVTMGLGSDATGDIYYNNGGVLTRLPKGTNGQALELVSGVPAWASISGTGTVTAIVAGTATVTGSCTTSCATVSYSQGTWTPVLAGATTAGTPTYTIQVGSYEIIGRQVTARFTVATSAWAGSPTGNVEITGLPVASSSATNDFGSCLVGNYSGVTLSSSTFGIGGLISPGSTVFTLSSGGATTSAAINAATVGATVQFVGTCHYHT